MKFLLLLVVLAAFVASSLSLNNAICGLPHSKDGIGNAVCLALSTRWSYNGKECVSFNYGGCGGNDNQFPSKAQCEATCLE